MDEKDFELLEVLAGTRNITRAAERLYITQSALSKRIRGIEEELGAELLLRSRQGIRLTPAGELALSRCRAAARELTALRQSLAGLGEEVSGTLSAGVSVNFAQYRLPDILADYHRRYPRVRLQLTTGQSRHLHRQLLEGSLDVAILRGDHPWDGEKYLLSQEPICVVRARQLAEVPLSRQLYISRQTDPALSALLTQWLRENGLGSRQTGICVDSITTCLEMVRRGLGWGLLPRICLGEFDGDIRPCAFQNGEPLLRRTYLLFTREAARLPQVAAFLEGVKKGEQSQGVTL